MKTIPGTKTFAISAIEQVVVIKFEADCKSCSDKGAEFYPKIRKHWIIFNKTICLQIDFHSNVGIRTISDQTSVYVISTNCTWSLIAENHVIQ